ncbi:hypothetical protein amrb99_54700 [Actinomadura sp. RB99]|nr:hypothetical protein [Actinomadura sp. RB99]
MLLFRASLPLSRQTPAYAASVVCRHRKKSGSKSRVLPPGLQCVSRWDCVNATEIGQRGGPSLGHGPFLGQERV